MKPIALFAAIPAIPAHAQVTLIARGALIGSSAGPDADLSGLKGTVENGVPANLLSASAPASPTSPET